MHSQPKGAGDRDLRNQSVVLSYVLDQHPVHPSIPALVRDLAEDASDAYERAIRDLTAAGLLRCPGGIVEPTEAALHFDRLPLS
jgi:hypothetical protein